MKRPYKEDPYPSLPYTRYLYDQYFWGLQADDPWSDAVLCEDENCYYPATAIDADGHYHCQDHPHPWRMETM